MPMDNTDLSITRIAGLTWNEWNARLAMPLVTMREGVHPLVFPTDLTINSDKHSNLTTSNIATGSAASSIADRKSPCFGTSNTGGSGTTATPPNELSSTGGASLTTTSTPRNGNVSNSNVQSASEKLAGKLKHLTEEEAAALMLKAAAEKSANNSGNMSDNSYGGDDTPGNTSGGGAGDYHSALSGAGAFGDVVGNAAGLCNINILSSISAMNSLIGGGNGGIGIGAGGGHPCPECGRVYKLKSSLRNHQKWECGKEPQFQCPFCVYRAKQKMHIGRHMERMHKEKFIKLEDIKSYTGERGSDEGSSAAAAAATAAELRQHFS